jgi:hypothetical protein
VERGDVTPVTYTIARQPATVTNRKDGLRPGERTYVPAIIERIYPWQTVAAACSGHEVSL